MKYILPALLASFLFLTGCQDENASGAVANSSNESTYSFAASSDQDTARYRPLYLHDIPADVDGQTTSTGGYGQIAPPPLDRYEAQVLMKGTWTTEFYVDKESSRAQKMAGTGQWMRFYGDGTFKGGHWGTQTHGGAWYLNFTTEKPTLVIDSNVDQLDAWWEIHGITGAQDAMSWRRVPENSTGAYRKSVMTKMIELTDLPTKKQFEGQFNF